jgi:hypothetical protein
LGFICVGYYDTFPPKRMNVSIIDREPTSGKDARKVLSVNKDFAAGEVIYKACDMFRSKNSTNELLPNRNSLLSLL